VEFYLKLGALRATNSRETQLCKEPKGSAQQLFFGLRTGAKPGQRLLLGKAVWTKDICRGASKIKLKKVNKKRTVTIRMVLIFLIS
jgi:hypothetical protein